jgi:hypothetical protein
MWFEQNNYTIPSSETEGKFPRLTLHHPYIGTGTFGSLFGLGNWSQSSGAVTARRGG